MLVLMPIHSVHHHDLRHSQGNCNYGAHFTQVEPGTTVGGFFAAISTQYPSP